MKLKHIILLTWALATSLPWWNNSARGQVRNDRNTKEIQMDVNKSVHDAFDFPIENISQKPITHEQFMDENTTISDIEYRYWDEAINLIRKHILQEINNIRRENGKNELKINENLQKIAQKSAENLHEKGRQGMIWNWKWKDNLDTELKKSWITNLNSYLETKWQWEWRQNIKRIVDCLFEAKEQNKTPLFDKFNEIWIWIKCTKTDENGNIIEDNNNTTNEKVYYHVTRVIDFIWLNELSPKPVTHEEFMDKNTSINDIVYRYWDEALNIIREHILQEINKIRKENGKQELKINDTLQNFAQERAEYLYNKGILEHEWREEARYRLKKSGLTNYCICLENIWKRQKSINRIVYWQVESEKHYETMLFDKASEIWIWIKYIITDKYGNIIKDKNKITNDCTRSTLRVINFISTEE